MHATRRQREPVTSRPDDPAAPLEECRACGKLFGVVSLHADGTRMGRDKCPHCKADRPIPDALHPTYVQWFHLVKLAAAKCGGDPEAAFDGAHDVYRRALLRWVPDRGAFSTLAIFSLRAWAAQGRVPGAPLTLSQFVGDGGGAWAKENSARDGANTFEDSVTGARWRPESDDGAGDELADDLPRLRAALATLDDRSRRILEARHGIGRGRKATLREIAGELGISRERVRVLEARALARVSSTMQGGCDVEV